MPYYTKTASPVTQSNLASAVMRGEFALIEAAFAQVEADMTGAVSSTNTALTGVPTAPTAAPGTNTTQIATTAFVTAASLSASLPGQAGNAGKFLTTDGTTASWTASPVPSMTGNANKYLTTNGVTASWTAGASFVNMDINNQTGTSYTLVLADANKYIRMNNAAASTVIVPPNSTVAIAVGATVHVRQVGAGQVTIVADTGVTILTPETMKLRKAGAIISITKVDTDTWEIYGDLESLP